MHMKRKTHPGNKAHLAGDVDHSIGFDGLRVRTNSPWSVLGAHYFTRTCRNVHRTANGEWSDAIGREAEGRRGRGGRSRACQLHYSNRKAGFIDHGFADHRFARLYKSGY